jgi:hypothetical protein
MLAQLAKSLNGGCEMASIRVGYVRAMRDLWEPE